MKKVGSLYHSLVYFLPVLLNALQHLFVMLDGSVQCSFVDASLKSLLRNASVLLYGWILIGKRTFRHIKLGLTQIWKLFRDEWFNELQAFFTELLGRAIVQNIDTFTRTTYWWPLTDLVYIWCCCWISSFDRILIVWTSVLICISSSLRNWSRSQFDITLGSVSYNSTWTVRIVHMVRP